MINEDLAKQILQKNSNKNKEIVDLKKSIVFELQKIVSFTNKNINDIKKDITAINSIEVRNGIDGKDGTNGQDGKDGVNGNDGLTPKKGVDYFTEDEVDNIIKSVASEIDLTKFATKESLTEYKDSNRDRFIRIEKILNEYLEGLGDMEVEDRKILIQSITGGSDVDLSEYYTHTFETVSKNLKSIPSTLSYTGDDLTSITYSNGIIKTLNYTGDNLTSIVLSGSTPEGIDLTKTLSYVGDDLTEITYS